MKNTEKHKLLSTTMKRCLGLFFLLFTQLMLSETYAQTTNLISLKLKNAPVKEALDLIEKNNQINFFYADKDVDLNRKVTINVKDQTLDKVLEELFKNSTNSFKIDGKQVYITKKKKAVDDKSPASKKIKVIGVVTDQTGEAIIGATITEKGTKSTTITDFHGRFYMDVPEHALLSVSYMGYLAMEVNVGTEDFVKIEMLEDTKTLSEVVVVAYGTQKKLTTIGAQSSITIKDLKSQPIANMTNAISGRIAGIVGVQRSGEPGYDGSKIFIRGISTFTDSSPLVLVDGIERSFNNIDPEDIAGFTVLKDASATAVYGVRGANGVILIETKKGEVGKPKINVQMNQGITQFTQIPDFADGVTYMKLANEANKNTYPTETKSLYSDEAIQKTADGSDPDLYPNVNWMKELFKKNGQNHRINLNVSGGSEKAKYYLSVGTYNETGMFKVDNMANYNSAISFDRYNFTSNLTLQVLKNTKMEFGASGWISNGNYPGSGTGGIWDAAFRMTPISVPVRYSDGKFSGVKAGDVPNPYNLLTQTGYVNETRSQIMSNIRITQDLSQIVKGLSLTGLFSFDNYNSLKISRTKSVDEYLATGRDELGNLVYYTGMALRNGTSYLGFGKDNGGNRQFYSEAALNYNNTFGKHAVSGLVLYNQRDKVDAFANDFISSIPSRYQGVAARATYTYDNKYLSEVNLGYNGAETFEKGHRFGLFPSIGIGWIPSSEAFFEPLINVVQFLKFRGSYGIVGNSNIGNGRRFGYITTVSENTGSGYSYGSTQDKSYDGLDFDQYASSVSWEKAKKLNIGFEFRALKNALSLTVDFFQENRTNIFLQRGDLPQYIGVRNSVYGNLGEMYSKGLDGTLTFNKQITKDLAIEFRGNLTLNKATVVEDANAPWPYPWQQRIGRKYGQRFGKTALGLFQSEEEVSISPYQTENTHAGDIKFKDLNGDGKIDSYDEGPIGKGSMPEMVYGFGPSISYKGFALGAWFKGISSVDISVGGEGFQPFSQQGTRGNLLSVITDRWTENNPGNNHLYPRLTYPSSVNMNYSNSSWWIKDGAFMRLQNVEFSYTFKQMNWLKSIGLSHLRAYAIGYNLLTFSNFKLWDVELGDGKGASYPLTKTLNFGIECNF